MGPWHGWIPDTGRGALTSSCTEASGGGLLLQEQFAEGLASCINSRMGPTEQHQQEQLRESMARNIADAAEAAAAQSQVRLLHAD